MPESDVHEALSRGKVLRNMSLFLTMCMCYAGVIESSFAEYLHGFTDQPASALEDLTDSTGYQRQPFLKRLLPRQVRLAFILILLTM